MLGEIREALLVAIRWSHAAAAVALVGGSAFQLLIVSPALQDGGELAESARRRVQDGFKELVDITLVMFLVSGGLLTFERLSSGAAGTAYVVVLGAKIVLSVVLYRWAFRVRRSWRWDGLEAKLLVAAGFLVVLLASVLKTLYEGNLRT